MSSGRHRPLRIGVFLQGTTIMHAAAASVGRNERVEQVRMRDPSVAVLNSYVPTPGSVEKLAQWSSRGATLIYLSPHTQRWRIDETMDVVRRHGFPKGEVYGRDADAAYEESVERLELDVLVEDDCESIGGPARTIASQLSPTTRRSIRCIVVPEFVGLGHLPDDPRELLSKRL